MKKIFLLFLCFVVFEQGRAQHRLAKAAQQSLDLAVKQYKLMNASLAADVFPRNIDTIGNLVTNKRNWWTAGFFPSTLWYLYEYSHNPALKEMAVRKTNELREEVKNSGDHDIGFKIWCSYGNQLRITKDSSLVPLIIEAARSLSKRFDPAAGLIRSWGKIGDQNEYLVIIDNMMNLELLFEASRLSGDSYFYRIAVSHADKTMVNHFRADGSSWHVVNYDPATGAVKSKRTAQGYSDSSAWARGQAWGLYGYTMCYRETGDKKYLDEANGIAHFILTNKNLPEDLIPYWDFNDPKIPDTYRDASAAAIIASALLELRHYAIPSQAAVYEKTAKTILQNLSKSDYRTGLNEKHDFLLKHSVGHLAAKSEVDTPLSYADYYYVEGLMRLLKK